MPPYSPAPIPKNRKKTSAFVGLILAVVTQIALIVFFSEQILFFLVIPAMGYGGIGVSDYVKTLIFLVFNSGLTAYFIIISALSLIAGIVLYKKYQFVYSMIASLLCIFAVLSPAGYNYYSENLSREAKYHATLDAPAPGFLVPTKVPTGFVLADERYSRAGYTMRFHHETLNDEKDVFGLSAGLIFSERDKNDSTYEEMATIIESGIDMGTALNARYTHEKKEFMYANSPGIVFMLQYKVNRQRVASDYQVAYTALLWEYHLVWNDNGAPIEIILSNVPEEYVPPNQIIDFFIKLLDTFQRVEK